MCVYLIYRNIKDIYSIKTMGRFWSCFATIAAASLLLIAVPIRYNPYPNDQLKSQFEEYVRAYNKTYRNDSMEYEKRFRNFQESMTEIRLLNAASRGPEQHRARFGPSPFSDMSKAEFSEIHLSDEKATSHRRRKYKNKHTGSSEVNRVRRKRSDVPSKFDWRDKGYVGSIKNQGTCGACWAFATVGTIETMAAIKTGTFVPLSVQEMIDCAGSGNRGCSGGDICLLLEWLELSKAAVQREQLYPLTGSDNACKLNSNSSGIHVTGATCESMVGLEKDIISLLATHGPVAVAVNAITWQHYLGGVIQYHCSGSPLDLNHAVELIGYDLTAAVPHYIARNSWGAEFGEDGFLRLAIGENMCGLANEVATIDVAV